MNSSITDSHLRSNDFSAIVKSQVREILNLSRGIWNKHKKKKKKLVNSVTRGEKQADRQQSRVFSLTGQQQQKQEEDVVLT